MAYYQKVLGATNISRMPVSKEQAEQFGVTKEKLDETTMHSQFDILGTTIMAADNFHSDNLSYTGFSILLDLNSEDEFKSRSPNVLESCDRIWRREGKYAI